MKPKKPTLLCSIGGLLLATASVSAATISVNFGANHGSLAAGTESAGAISVSSPNWNNASNASGTLTALKDDAGTTTSAKVTWTSANTWQSSATDAAGNDNGTLTKGYLDDSTPGYTATVSGAYFLSNVYLILATDLNADPAVNVTLGGYKVNGTAYGWNGTATVAGVNSWTTANSWSNQNTLTEGKNYIKVTNVAGTVAVQGTRPTGGRSALAGIQVENAYAGTLLHWDIDGATAGAGGATPSGNWDGTASNWSADSTGASATSTWAADNVAVFSAGSDATGSYTVTLAGTQNARGLWLQDGSITFSGGTISLTNERAIVVDAGAHAFDSVIAADGAAQLSVAPGSSVTLNAANTFTGNVSNLGTVVLANVNAVQNATLTLGAGSTTTLGVAGTNTYNLGGLAGSNSINIGANSLSVGAGGTATTYSGVISGTGSLTKVGSGTLTLSGINTYTGGTTVDGGTLRLANGGSTGAIRGTLTANTGATIEIGGSDVFGYGGGATAVNTINLNNATLVQAMNRNETNTAVINMANGSTIAATGGANAKLDMYGNSAALNSTGDVTNTISSPINLRQNTTTFTVADGAAATDLLISGVISKGAEGNGAITKAGDGTMTLTGANTFTSIATVNAGTLALGNVDALKSATLNTGTAGAQTVTFAVAGTNTYNLGGLSGADDLDIGANSLSIGNNTPSAYTGTITGTGGITVKGGALAMGGTSTYSGATTIQGGYLEVSGSALTLTNSVLNIGAGANATRAVDIWAGDFTVRGLTGGTATTKIVSNAGLSLVVSTQAGDDHSFAGILANKTWNSEPVTLKLVKQGEGTQTLTGASLYTGGTTVTGGVLKAGHASAFGTGSITVSGGTLDLNGQTIANNVTLSGTGAVSNSAGTGIQLNNLALGTSGSVATGGQTLTVAGSLSGSGTITGNVSVLGNLSIGNSPGLLTVSGDTLLSATGISTFEIGGLTRGTLYDALDVGGTLTLDGSVVVTSYLFDPATLVAGDSFDLMNWGTLVSTGFDVSTDLDLSGMTLSSGLNWDTSQFLSNGTISVAAVPEPSSFACVMGLAALGALCTRRRRRD